MDFGKTLAVSGNKISWFNSNKSAEVTQALHRQSYEICRTNSHVFKYLKLRQLLQNNFLQVTKRMVRLTFPYGPKHAEKCKLVITT
jgi:hypothetical protein